MSFNQAAYSSHMDPQALKILYMCTVVNWCIFSLYSVSLVWLIGILTNFFVFEGRFRQKTKTCLKNWSNNLLKQPRSRNILKQERGNDIEGLSNSNNGAYGKPEYISSHIPGSLFLKTPELKYSMMSRDNNDDQSVVTTIYPTPSTLYNLYAQNSAIKQQLLGKQLVSMNMVHPAIISKLDQISSNEDRCLVCIEEFQSDDLVQPLPCNHYFHTKCISKWITQHEESRCPLCQFDIEDKVSIFSNSPDQGYAMYTPVGKCTENLESGSTENDLANVVNEFGSA